MEIKDEEVKSGNCGRHANWRLEPDGTLRIYGTGEACTPDVSFQIYDEKIEHLMIGDGITAVSGFRGLHFLSDVWFPESLRSIGNFAFTSSHIKDIILPSSLESIGEAAFQGCSELTEMIFPEGVKEIGSYAFCDCNLLEKISFSGSIQHIGWYAFAFCRSLQKAVERERILHEDFGVFFECKRLKISGNALIDKEKNVDTCESIVNEKELEQEQEQKQELVLKLSDEGAPVTKEDIRKGFKFQIKANQEEEFSIYQDVRLGESDVWCWTGNRQVAVARPKREMNGQFFVRGIATGETERRFFSDRGMLSVPVHVDPGDFFFEDVREKTAYYYDAVYWAVNCGITKGYSGNRLFAPERVCTRAQVLTFLWRAYGAPEMKHESKEFLDVPGKSWFSQAVSWAVEKGILDSERMNHSFMPEATSTKAETINFLWKVEDAPAETGSVRETGYLDITEQDWCASPVLWAYRNRILTEAKYFHPNLSVKRGEVVTYLYRLLEGKKMI